MEFDFWQLKDAAQPTKKKMLAESKCVVLDLLAKDFGEKAVYSRWQLKAGQIQPNMVHVLEKLYSILNLIMFGNALKQPQIESMRRSQAEDEAGSRCCGVYQYVVKVVSRNGRPAELKLVPSRSKIVLFLDDQLPPLTFVASTLCHEMIHQYVAEVGNGIEEELEAMATGKPYDPHAGQFKKLMDTVNKATGLHIEQEVDNLVLGYIESIYKARTKNDSYKDVEDEGLYDGVENYGLNIVDEDDDNEKTLDPTPEKYLGDQDVASEVIDAIDSEDAVRVTQIGKDTIQVSIA